MPVDEAKIDVSEEGAVVVRDARLPLYQQLRDELAAQIAAHRWRPGDPIPSESELTKRFSVATGTVRKAIDALVADGLVERTQGKGTFVRRPRFDASLFRFFRFESVGGERRIPASRILKRQMLTAPSAVVSALKLPRGAKVIRLTRLRVVDDQPLLVEDIWLPHARFAALMDVKPSGFPSLLYPMFEQTCGQVVASAGETLTVELAAATHAALLQLPPGTPVIVIERVAHAYDGSPLEWRRSRGPADRFRYHVEIR